MMVGLNLGLGLGLTPNKGVGWWGTAKLWRDFERSLGSLGDPTVTSASTRYAKNKAGVYLPFAANVPAITDDGLQVVPSSTQLHQNPQLTNAVNGALGSGGAYPTGMSAGGNDAEITGITRTVVGSGTDSLTGLKYVDIRFQFTSSAGPKRLFDRLAVSSALAISASTKYTFSNFVRVVGGSFANMTFAYDIVWQDAASATTGENFTSNLVADATTQRYTYTNTSPALTTKAEFRYSIFAQAAGTYDCTLRILQPQVEALAYASSPILSPATVAGDQAVYDLAGRLDLSLGVALAVKLTLVGATADQDRIVEFNDGTTNERIILANTSGNLRVQAVHGGSVVAFADIATMPGVGSFTVGLACSDNFLKARVVGQSDVAAATGPFTAPTTESKLAMSGSGLNTLRNALSVTDKVAAFDGLMSQSRWDNQVWPVVQQMALAA